MKKKIDYLKEVHPNRVVDNDYKYKFIIGEYNINDVRKKYPDRVLVQNKTNQLEHRFINNFIQDTINSNKKYIILSNSVYILKFVYGGEFEVIEDGTIYTFDEYESFINYLSVYESR